MPDLDDDDFDDLFAKFNDDDHDDFVMMSQNLRQLCGLSETPVHAGEADEGRVTWLAPSFSGLGNSSSVKTSSGRHWNAEDAEEASLWEEPSPEATAGAGTTTTAMSANLVQDLAESVAEKQARAEEALKGTNMDEAKEVSEIFERLVSHGKGIVVLDENDFRELLTSLANDELGHKLLEVLLLRKKLRSAV